MSVGPESSQSACTGLGELIDWMCLVDDIHTQEAPGLSGPAGNIRANLRASCLSHVSGEVISTGTCLVSLLEKNVSLEISCYHE